MKIVKAILILLVIALAFAAGFGYGRFGKRAAPAGRKILYYVDPMHPAYRSDRPGVAPDCGMKLEPVYAGEGAAGAAHAKPDINPETGEDIGAIQIPAERQRLIGVRYGQAEITGGEKTFRSTGKVAFDETAITRVHARVDGWIDQVFVDFTGKAVEKGQKLLTLYSPELLSTQQEYLLALKSRELMKASLLHAAMGHGDSLAEASRRKLELLDLTAAQIDELARTGQPVRNITLYAPASGHVIARNSFPKQRITPETELYAIADLSKVWVLADVFESDAPLVRMGQPVSVTLPYAHRTLAGTVSYLQPQMDPATRTLRVRIELPNPGLLLKPDMFVDAEFRIPLARRITVPVEAVVDTGLKKTVFVDRGNGVLEPRTVETGERGGDRIEILKGLRAGERIVTSGNFLIDSETRLKAGAPHD